MLPLRSVARSLVQGRETPSRLRALISFLEGRSQVLLVVYAFELFASGARTGKKAEFEKAQAKIDQGDIDAKLIRDLNQGGPQ
jgi:hypothetical protein